MRLWQKLTDLHSTTQTKHQVQRRLLLNVVVGKSTAVLKLLASENQTLLVRRDTLLVLDLALNVVDGVARLDLESDGLAGNYRSQLVKTVLVALKSDKVVRTHGS